MQNAVGEKSMHTTQSMDGSTKMAAMVNKHVSVRAESWISMDRLDKPLQHTVSCVARAEVHFHVDGHQAQKRRSHRDEALE
jgi:hypothetical protein